MYYLHYTLTGCRILDWALMCSVTVLLLLGLWLSAVWAVGCCNELGVYGNNYSKGRVIITIYTDSQPLSPHLYSWKWQFLIPSHHQQNLPMHHIPSCHGQASDLQVQLSWWGGILMSVYTHCLLLKGVRLGIFTSWATHSASTEELELELGVGWFAVLCEVYCVDGDGFGGWGLGKLVSGWNR